MCFELQTFCLMKGQFVVNSCFVCIYAEKDIYIYIYIYIQDILSSVYQVKFQNM